MQYRESLEKVLAIQTQMEEPNTQAVWSLFMPEMAFDCPGAIQFIQDELVKPAHLKECILKHGDLGIKQYAEHWGENPNYTYLTNRSEIQSHFRKLFTSIYLDLERKDAEASIDLYAGKLAANLILVRETALLQAIQQKVADIIDKPEPGARAELVRHFYLKDSIERSKIIIEQIAPLYAAEYLKTNTGLSAQNQIHDFFETHQIVRTSTLACEIKKLIINRIGSDIISNNNSTNRECKTASIAEVIASNLGKHSLNEILKIIDKDIRLSDIEQKDQKLPELIINQAKEKIREFSRLENQRFEPIINLVKSLKLNQDQDQENEINKEIQPILAKFLINLLLDNESANLLGSRIVRDEENSLVTGLAKLTQMLKALKNTTLLIQDPQIRRAYCRIREQAEGPAEKQLIKILDRTFGLTS